MLDLTHDRDHDHPELDEMLSRRLKAILSDLLIESCFKRAFEACQSLG